MNDLINTLAHIAYGHLQEMFVAADHATERFIAQKRYGDAYEASIRRNALADAAIAVKARILQELNHE